MGAGKFDVIVLGVGAMGSGACHHLAERGLSVLGLERFEVGHDRGSSHGQTRVIRKAYFEDPRYVPMLHRAYELWRELEAAAGEPLMQMAGCLNLGPAQHVAIRGVRKSVETHRLPHWVLSGRDVQDRWPVFRCDDDDVGVYEEDAGFLFPERCIAVQVALAKSRGATVLENHQVFGWRASYGGVTVQTSRGDFDGRHLVITCGAWLPVVMADLGLPIRIERQVQAWFRPARPDEFAVGRMPVFIHFSHDRAYYGIPIGGQCPPYDRAIKVARHHGGVLTTADTVDRQVGPTDEADIRGYMEKHLPGANGPRVAAKVCLYSNTPDEHFIIDQHPGHPNVMLTGGFSGHGFKFAPVVGEILAELITRGRTRHAIDFFSIARFR